jgi:hypothetical protein
LLALSSIRLLGCSDHGLFLSWGPGPAALFHLFVAFYSPPFKFKLSDNSYLHSVRANR